MANYKVVNADQLDSDLETIASKIREKTGNSQALTFPEGFISEISAIETGGEEIPAEAFHLTGNLSYAFSYNKWAFLVENYGNKITTSNITSLTSTFNGSELEKIDFDLNCNPNQNVLLTSCFNSCTKLKSIPKINDCLIGDLVSAFSSMLMLQELPEDIDDWFNWIRFDTAGIYRGVFENDYSLRRIPMIFLNHGTTASSSYGAYQNAFSACYVLDELIGFPINTNGIPTRNLFASTFYRCQRLKDLIFAMQNGTPYVVQWKGQIIDLSTNVGYGSSAREFTSYNSGITADKEVKNASTYQSLKNDPDWFTTSYAFSRYNHDSAVNTINSLPDTSAYLATAGGTNTIKFKGTQGSSTDGGAIKTLTEAEIAVATAKGWTVTLS